jgi:hypothetical protein
MKSYRKPKLSNRIATCQESCPIINFGSRKGCIDKRAESPLSTVAPASKVESGYSAPFSSYCLPEIKLSRSEASHQSSGEANFLSVSRRIHKRPASRR